MSAARVLRDLAALLVIVVACPAALLGGALLGCTTTGVTAECALQGISIAPFLLVLAGVVAGLLAGGARGLVLLGVGILVGMTAIAVVSGVAGSPVRIDPLDGAIATIWVGAPVVVGYGIGRGISRLYASRS